MTKILDTNYISCPVPKYVELRKGVLINGQYHLKDTMQPVPFAQCVINDVNVVSGVRYTFLDRAINYADTNSTGSLSMFNNSTIIYDSVDENICYKYSQSGITGSIYKYDESNNRCKMIKQVVVISDTFASACNFYEEDGFLYFVYSSSVSNLTIYKYTKDNLIKVDNIPMVVSINGATYPYFTQSNITKNLYSATQSSLIDLVFYSKAQNKAISTRINNLCATSNCLNVSMHNAYKETNEYIKVLVPNPKAGAASYISEFNLVTFNKLTELWIAPVIVPVVGADAIVSPFISNYLTEHDMFSRTFGGKTYIFIYERHILNSAISRVYVYEITIVADKEVITFVKMQNMPAGQGGAIIHFKEDPTLKFYGTCKNGVAPADIFSSVYCYELNETTLEFEKTLSIDGLIRDFGFDKERNLFVTWADYSIDKYNTKTVANFNARFAEGLYEYQGVDILTNLIVSTANLQGVLLAKDVTLEMKGNAKFTATDNKSISVTTLTTGDLNIPVTITGAGSLNIFPKVKA